MACGSTAGRPIGGPLPYRRGRRGTLPAMAHGRIAWQVKSASAAECLLTLRIIWCNPQKRSWVPACHPRASPGTRSFNIAGAIESRTVDGFARVE